MITIEQSTSESKENQQPPLRALLLFAFWPRPRLYLGVCRFAAKVNLTSTKLDHISLPEELPEVPQRYEGFT